MRIDRFNRITAFIPCLAILAASASSAFGADFTIGGTLSDLEKSESITLELNGKDPLKLMKNGTFTFTTKLATGASYVVKVSAEPVGQTCTIKNAKGTVAKAAVKNVDVNCTLNDYTIGGDITGLGAHESVTLELNGKHPQAFTKNGPFTFTEKLAYKSSYKVTVSTESAGLSCSVTAHGSGTVGAGNLKDVVVVCKAKAPATFSIGGKVTWPTSGISDSVTLSTNGETKPVPAGTGSFTFPTKLATGTKYNVSVTGQPTGGTCNVTGGGSGTVGTANVTNVAVTCTATPPVTFSIGGNVTWPKTGVTGSVTLGTNSENVTVAAGTGSFTFPTKLATGTKYSIGVTTQPTGGTCSVTGGGSGTIASSNITNVAVTCTASSSGGGGGSPFWIPLSALAITDYTIGGTVSGLNSSTSVTLSNLSDMDSVTVTANGPFTFPKSQADSASYSVFVSTPPTGETCTVTNGSGSVDAVNIKSIIVSCSVGAPAAPPRIATAGFQPKREARSVTSRFLNPAAARITSAHASPMTDPPAGGQSGIFLIASNNLESNPAPTPTWITTTPATIVAVVPQITVTSNAISGYAPDLIAYYQIQSDGTTQFFGLNISNTSATPTPTPIGAPIPSTQQVCHVTPIFTDLTDPTSGVAIIGVATGAQGICGASPTLSYEILQYTTPSSTAPTPIPITSDPIGTLYTNNLLTGILVMDSTNNAIDFYTDATFKTVSQVVTDACYATSVGEATLQDGTAFGNTIEYFNVTAKLPSTPCSTKTGATTLYRIDSTSGGTAKQILANQVGPIVSDDNNVYFIYTNSTNTQGTIYEGPISGSTDPAELYTTPLTFNPMSEEQSLGLIGSNNSKLVFALETLPLTSEGIPEENLTTSNVYTVPVGSLTTTTSTLASNLPGNVGGFLAPSSGTGRSSDVLFLNISNIDFNLMNDTQTWAFSSTAGPLTGTLPAATAKSLYNAFGLTSEFGPVSGQANNTVFQIKNITETDGGYGGGNLFSVDVGTLAGTEMTTTGGGDYQIPTGYFGVLELPYSTSIAIGDFLPYSNHPSDATPEFGTAADLTRNFILQVGLTDTNVFAY